MAEAGDAVSRYRYVTYQAATSKHAAGWLAQVWHMGKQTIVGSRHPTALKAAQTAAKYLTEHGIPTTVQMLAVAKRREAKMKVRDEDNAGPVDRLSKYMHVYRYAPGGRRPQWQAVVDYVTLGIRALEDEAGQLVLH